MSNPLIPITITTKGRQVVNSHEVECCGRYAFRNQLVTPEGPTYTAIIDVYKNGEHQVTCEGADNLNPNMCGRVDKAIIEKNPEHLDINYTALRCAHL